MTDEVAGWTLQDWTMNDGLENVELENDGRKIKDWTMDT